MLIVARRRPGSAADGATLAIATCLATPFLLDYDLMLLAIPLAWVSAKAEVNGYMAWEKVILGSAFLLPLLSRVLALNANFPVAPFVLIALLWVVARRAWLEPTDLRRRYEERNALA